MIKSKKDELVTELRVNRDLVKWFHYLPVKKGSLAKTQVCLVGDAKTIEVMESPEQIETMATDILNIRVHEVVRS